MMSAKPVALFGGKIANHRTIQSVVFKPFQHNNPSEHGETNSRPLIQASYDVEYHADTDDETDI
jgi:hypothetical protein